MKTLFIIDAYNLIYRMFYAIPEMHTRSGEVVNAIFGVAKFLKSLSDEHPTDAIIIATDVGQSFRAKEYSEYKAQRDRMPDNLRSQIDGVFSLFEAAGIQILSQEGYEADDLIGSLVTERSNGWTDYQFVIISSDKDLCQFVRDGHIHIYDAMKQKFMKEKDILEKFGVPVTQVRDYLAIVGDSSDNIPGIAGFGPKKAEELLSKYGTLEWVYAALWMVNGEWWMDGKLEYSLDSEKFEKSELSAKLKQWLLDNRDNAFLSQKLATIITDLDVTLHLTESDTLRTHVSKLEYQEILRTYEFRSLLPRDEVVVTKHLEKQEIQMIMTIEWLDHLRESILKNGSCSLATDGSGIALWSNDELYVIDPTGVDTVEFIAWLLGADVEIRWYDLKADYKRLLAIQKPLQKVSEGQGKLF